MDHEELSRCLFKESNDAFFIFDSDENLVLDVNPTSQRLTGFRRKELIGRGLSELFDTDTAHSVEELIDAYQSTGIFHSKEGYFLRRAAGEPLSVNVSVSRIHTAPKPLGLIVARDISKRKRMEVNLKARERQQTAVAELSQEALAGVTPEELMRLAVARVAATLDVEYCSVLQLLPEGQALLLQAGYGWNDGCIGLETFGTGKSSQPGYTLSTNQPVIVENLRSETRFNVSTFLINHGVVSGASVVIHDPDKPNGVLGVYSKTARTFSDAEVQFLQSVANLMALSMRRKRAEVLARERAAAQALLAQLSPREHNVMDLIVAGRANKIVARELNISEKTVEKHRSNVMKKLKRRNLAALVRLALIAELYE